MGQAVSPARPLSMPEYRRRLPHFQRDDAYLFLTWRLWGSLPPKPLSHRYPTPGHAFVAADRILHRDRSGPLWLGQPRIARLVIMRWLKGSTARRANRLLERTGRPFWQDESYDHWVRDSAELRRITRYIEWNPVRAGFVTSPELWPWSSARQVGNLPHWEHR